MKPLQAENGIIWVQRSESTNSELKAHISEYDNLSVIAASEQTAGRGQGDHKWFSSPATNLTFSILFRFGPGFPVSARSADAVLVTWISTLAVRDYLLEKGIESRIKWPNDIWVDERKICGMLIENISCAGMLEASISGIGVNVNQESWPEELPNPISMKQITGKGYDLDKELHCITEHLRRRYMQAATAEGRHEMEEEFGKHMFRLPSRP